MYFKWIAEHEGRHTELPMRDFFYESAYFFCFFLIYFYLTIWQINVKSCFDVFAPWSTRLMLYLEP